MGGRARPFEGEGKAYQSRVTDEEMLSGRKKEKRKNSLGENGVNRAGYPVPRHRKEDLKHSGLKEKVAHHVKRKRVPDLHKKGEKTNFRITCHSEVGGADRVLSENGQGKTGKIHVSAQ